MEKKVESEGQAGIIQMKNKILKKKKNIQEE